MRLVGNVSLRNFLSIFCRFWSLSPDAFPLNCRNADIISTYHSGWFECHAHDDDDGYGSHFGYKLFLIKHNIFHDTRISLCIANVLFLSRKKNEKPSSAFKALLTERIPYWNALASNKYSRNRYELWTVWTPICRFAFISTIN